LKEEVMAKKHESKWNIEDLTEPEIYEAIRYLESNSKRRAKESEDSGVVICVSLLILLLGCLGVLLLYWR
jgi:hypothetical protein